MRIAIAQPTYLPWLGYFDLLDQVERFVLLDTVQFEKRSWQQRNRIKTPAGLQWLTIPVASRGRREQRILDAEIQDAGFWRDHLRTIEVNYRRAPFFDQYFDALSGRIRAESEPRKLCAFTIGLLRWLAELMGIKTRTVRSSELPVQGKRTHLLGEICASLGASAYLSPLGSAEYLLSELKILTERGVEPSFHHYDHPTYKQLFPPFLPYACVLDLLFNEGGCALQIIRSGRRKPFLPEEAASHVREKVRL